MNTPTIEMISEFVKAMPALGDGEVICEAGENTHSVFSSAHGIFEHDRKNWNVLGLVRIDEALELDKWLKLEAVLWAVGLSLPGGSRHDSELGPYIFGAEEKRRFGNWIERFLRNAAGNEASPCDWIAYAKDQGGHEFAQLAALGNPKFRRVWEESADAPAARKVEAVTGNKNPPKQQQFQEQAILRVLASLSYDPKALPKNKPGKPGVKAAVRNELKLSVSVFKKAWERLKVKYAE